MTIETNSKQKLKIQNDASPKPKDYQKALELAELGKYVEALECIREYLNSSPGDAEALNDAGAILYCMYRWDEAVNHLVKARDLQPDSGEIIWNLSETYLSAEKTTEAAELFDDMERLGILNAEVLNRTANILLSQNHLSEAAEMLDRSLKLWPDQEVLPPMIEVICGKIDGDNSE